MVKKQKQKIVPKVEKPFETYFKTGPGEIRHVEKTDGPSGGPSEDLEFLSQTIYNSGISLTDIKAVFENRPTFEEDKVLHANYMNNLEGMLAPINIITDKMGPLTLSSKPHNQKICNVIEHNMVLIMIVKNESKIITRCLDSIKAAGVTAICITDTGSVMPDNPDDYCPNIIQAWAIKNEISCVVSVHPYTPATFKFSLTRTQSFLNALHYYPNAKYFMTLDADMELVTHPQWAFEELNGDQILLNQVNNNSSYFNARIFKSRAWVRCIGATHESWTVKKKGNEGDAQIQTVHNIEIKDNNDGQCKSDKYIRDKYLLENEICNPRSPTFIRHRNLFYLAQTNESLGRYDDSAELYKLYYEKGGFWNQEGGYWYSGWDQERWTALYRVGLNYLKLLEQEKKFCLAISNKMNKTKVETKKVNKKNRKAKIAAKKERKEKEKAVVPIESGEYIEYLEHHLEKRAHKKSFLEYMNSAYNFRPSRAEPLYQLAKYYREKGNNLMGFSYAQMAAQCGYPVDDTLFLDHGIYLWGIDTEISISAFWVPGKKNLGALSHKKVKNQLAHVDHITRSIINQNDQFYRTKF